MELPDFCLPYMANIAGLTSAQAPMTYLSWDECKACVLGISASARRKSGHARGPPGMDGDDRMNLVSTLRLAALIPMAAIVLGGIALAQTPTPAASPSPSPSATPAPAASAPPAPAAPATPAPAASATPAPAASPTATPSSPPAAAQTPATPPPATVQTADPFGEQFSLEAKKVVVMKGTATWDAAFDTLVDSFKALTALLDKQGIKPAGNVMIVYTSTDDTGFTYLAQIPVEV
jgi:hypothetical protein